MTANALHHLPARHDARRRLAVVGGDDRAAETIRVVIAHGQRLARAGLRAFLAGDAGLDVVGEAADGDEAVALVRGLRPAVVVVDVDLPGLDCVEATRRMRAESPVAVLVLASSEHDGRVFAALRAGAAGQVLSDREPAEVVCAVRRLAGGGRPRGRDVSTRRIHREGRAVHSNVIEMRRRPAHDGGRRWNSVI